MTSPAVTACRTPLPDLTAEIRETLRILQRDAPGVVETRIFPDAGGTVAGYFDSVDALAKAVAPHDGRAAIYMTLNRVPASVLARCANRLGRPVKGAAGRDLTSDAIITRRLWLMLDVDASGVSSEAPRVSGVSATNEEKALALGLLDDIVTWLCEDIAWAEPVRCDSGNGAHALFAIDLPNTKDVTDLLKRVLHALAARFNTPHASLDESVFNASRITKLYGTVAVKGDSTPDRPHRRSFITAVPEPVGLVTEAQLRAVAALAPSPAPSPSTAASPNGSHPRATGVDLVEAFRERGAYKQPLGAGKHGVICPWELLGESHADRETTAALFEPKDPGGPWGFHCFECGTRGIRDVLAWLHAPTGDTGTFLGSASNGHPVGEAVAAASVSWADGRALYERPVRRVAHLVEGLIPAAGLVLVTGEDKAGKTTVAALLGLCYLYALPFLGRGVPQAGSVIIVSEEDDGDELRDRMRAEHQALAVAHPDQVAPPDDPASLALVAERLIWEAREGVRLDDPTMITSLVAQITRLRARTPDGPPVLVLIDSLQAVRGLLDPTKPEGIAVLKVVLRQLTAAGAVVVLIAHARKVTAGGKRTSRASQEVAASHELAAEAAATLGLMSTGPRADAPVRLDLVSKRGKSGVVGYLKIAYDPPDTWPPQTIAISVEEAPGPSVDARAAASDRKVIEALEILPVESAATGEPGISRSRIMVATKLGDRTVQRSLDRLTAAGEVGVTGALTSRAKLFGRTSNARV